MHPISFPGLHIVNLYVPTDIVTFGNFRITWYGVLIAAGLLLAMFYVMKRAPQFGVSDDDFTDVLIFSLVLGIIGARAYYIIFDPNRASDYPNFISMLQIWNGGLGIYGGIIVSFITAFVVCRVKKISTGAVFDLGALGFLIGQCIGRWGNFFNQEAYGSVTNLPWGMKIYDYISHYDYVTVHPCFLYESIWCLIGFLLLHNYSKKHRKFNGEIFLMYIMWYGFGRFFIEGLRTDSLYIGATIKVSQLVAVVTFIAALVMYIVKRSGVRANANAEGYDSVYDDAAEALTEREEELSELQKLDEDEDEDNSEDDENSEEGSDAASEDESGDKAEDTSEDKSGDTSEDEPEDKDEDTSEDKSEDESADTSDDKADEKSGSDDGADSSVKDAEEDSGKKKSKSFFGGLFGKKR
jgi:phosphatidylglycerol:prolipoprotein diacylglycerol transferase